MPGVEAKILIVLPVQDFVDKLALLLPPVQSAFASSLVRMVLKVSST